LGLSANVQKTLFAASTFLFVFGFVTLFRFAAAYLYRNNKDTLSGRRFRVFRKGTATDYATTLELLHLVIMFTCLAAVSAAVLVEGGIMVPQPIVADKPVYFPLWMSTKIVLSMGLFVTALCILWFFLAKFSRIKNGEPLDGVEFITVMIFLFFVPCLVQVTALAPFAAGLELWIVGLWLAVFGLVCMFIGITWEDDAAPTSSVAKGHAVNLKRIKTAILISMAGCLGHAHFDRRIT
jgi:hypothetical protein